MVVRVRVGMMVRVTIPQFALLDGLVVHKVGESHPVEPTVLIQHLQTTLFLLASGICRLGGRGGEQGLT